MSEPAAGNLSRRVVSALVERHLTIAVAESLTGGLLVAELIKTAGASAAVNGGIVAYHTRLKHTLLGVDLELLDDHGPVHPEVARQMASGVRRALAVGDAAADFGLATTGVAGPASQDGHPVGTVFLGLAHARGVAARELALSGSRAQIRSAVVTEALLWLLQELGA